MKRKESMRESYARRMREKIATQGWPQSNGKGPRSSFDPKKARTPLKKIGKRGRKRQQMNAKLNLLGIDYCELRLPGCWGNRGLTWAHSRKSRFLVTDEDWLHAARGCLNCHRIIEEWTHEAMFEIVSQAISRRE